MCIRDRLIDRITSITVDQNALLNTGNQIVDRFVVSARLKRNIRHPWEGDAAPTFTVQTAVRLLLSREGSEIASSLPVNKHSIFDQVPALTRNTFVVVTDCRQARRLRPVCDEVND